jgi:hypothetical protein
MTAYPLYVTLCDDGLIRMTFENDSEAVNVALTPETALDLSASFMEALEKLPQETRQALYEKAMQEYRKKHQPKEKQMKQYLGTKYVNAQPMTRGDYNTLRGWKLPDNENGEDAGYLVEYTDGGKPNHADYAGYISWSPADVFERAYQPTASGMNFGKALSSLKLGVKVARAGWNGKNMFIFLVPGSTFKVSRAPLLGIYPEGTEINYHAHIDMKTTDDKIVPWLASQTDVLADDWNVVE